MSGYCLEPTLQLTCRWIGIKAVEEGLHPEGRFLLGTVFAPPGRATILPVMQLKYLIPIAWLLIPGARAQQTDASTIQTLIQEVRQLRLAIERSSTLVPRLQLTLARYQAQQSRVERLEGEMRTMQALVATESASKDRMIAIVSQSEEQVRQAQDPALRKRFENELAGWRQEFATRTQRDQAVRLQEADLSAQVKLEQTKLNELSSQLDQFERKMQDPR